jgi:hypothetical protein
VKTIVIATSIPLFVLSETATNLIAYLVLWSLHFYFDRRLNTNTKVEEHYTFHSRYVNDATRMLDIATRALSKKPTILIAGDFHHYQVG